MNISLSSSQEKHLRTKIRFLGSLRGNRLALLSRIASPSLRIAFSAGRIIPSHTPAIFFSIFSNLRFSYSSLFFVSNLQFPYFLLPPHIRPVFRIYAFFLMSIFPIFVRTWSRFWPYYSRRRWLRTGGKKQRNFYSRLSAARRRPSSICPRQSNTAFPR